METHRAGARWLLWLVGGLWLGSLVMLFGREPFLTSGDLWWLRRHHVYILWIAIASSVVLVGLLAELRPRSRRFQIPESWAPALLKVAVLELVFLVLMTVNITAYGRRDLAQSTEINALRASLDSANRGRDQLRQSLDTLGPRLRQAQLDAEVKRDIASYRAGGKVDPSPLLLSDDEIRAAAQSKP